MAGSVRLAHPLDRQSPPRRHEDEETMSTSSVSSAEDGIDRQFDIGTDLVAPPAYKVAGITETDFDGLLEEPLKLHEDLKEGCGGQLWPAGIVLAKYMLRNFRHDLKGKSIIELGAGGGLTGLAVAKGCDLDKPLIITDQLPMFALMIKNIALNDLGTKAEAAIFDWGAPVPDGVPTHPDIVLAADCVYFEPAFPLLLQTLKDLIGRETICYFCFKKRRRADLHFMKNAKKMFNVAEIEDDPDRAVYSRQSLFLYRFTAKR